jgi:hypothetical protein
MISPFRLKLNRTDICMPWNAVSNGGGSQHARSAARSSRSELIGPLGARPPSATRSATVMRKPSPIDGNAGTHGQGPNTPQNDGVHGAESKTLHGDEGSKGLTATAARMLNVAPVTTAMKIALLRQTDPMAPSAGPTLVEWI